jgi:hypothetical protein
MLFHVKGACYFWGLFQKGRWFPSAGESRKTFDVRFFHPEFFDRLLARHADVPRERRVQFYKSGTSYNIAIIAP